MPGRLLQLPLLFICVCGEAAKVIFIIADGRSGFILYIFPYRKQYISTADNSFCPISSSFVNDKSEQSTNSFRWCPSDICFFSAAPLSIVGHMKNYTKSHFEHINRNRLQWIHSIVVYYYRVQMFNANADPTARWQCYNEWFTIYNQNNNNKQPTERERELEGEGEREKLLQFKSMIRSFRVSGQNMKLVVINIPIDIE